MHSDYDWLTDFLFVVLDFSGMRLICMSRKAFIFFHYSETSLH